MDERSRMLWLPRSMSRRQLILGAGAAFIVGGAAACGGDDDDDDVAAPGTTGSSGTSGTSGTSGGTAPAGTTAGTAAAGAGTPGGTLRVGIVGSTNDLIDGQYIVTKTDQARLVAGWETLVNYDADFNISYEHGLAEEIETKAADLYVVRLKEGILFHGGQPVTADDVIYSFQRRLDTELGLAPALVELLDASGLTKVDDRTVEIQLKQPAVTFINGLAEYTATIVPTGYERFAGDAANQIGTGPYILQSFTPGAESVHTKNPDYWGEGRPYLDEVQIIDFADVAALVNALTSGEIDAAVDIPFAQVTRRRVGLQPALAGVGGRELAGDHDGRRSAAVRRRPRAPGDAPDPQPRGDGRSACCPATAGWATTCTACSTPATRPTSRSASRTSKGRWRCSPRPARRASRSTSSRPTTPPASPT